MEKPGQEKVSSSAQLHGAAFIFHCHPRGASPHFLSMPRGEAEPAPTGSSWEQSWIADTPPAWAAGLGQPSSQSPKQGTVVPPAPQECTALTGYELCCGEAVCHGEEEMSSDLCDALLHPHLDRSKRQDNIYLQLVSAEGLRRKRKQQEER